MGDESIEVVRKAGGADCTSLGHHPEADVEHLVEFWRDHVWNGSQSLTANEDLEAQLEALKATIAQTSFETFRTHVPDQFFHEKKMSEIGRKMEEHGLHTEIIN